MPRTGYAAVMELARENPNWIPVVRAAHEEAARCGEHGFAGTWVVQRVGWFPSLRPLAARGILERVHVARQGRRAYYRMLDPDGVREALDELSATKRSDGATPSSRRHTTPRHGSDGAIHRGPWENHAEEGESVRAWRELALGEAAGRIEGIEATAAPATLRDWLEAMERAVRPARYVPGKGIVLERAR